jgi:O-antigen/teichoic acid export membrane protein
MLTLQNVGNSLLGFFFLIAVIRLVPLTGYGIYSAVSVTVGIASTTAIMGLNSAAARFVALHFEDNRNASWDAARKIVFLSILLAAITTVAYVELAPYLSLYFTKSTTFGLPFVLGGGWIFSATLSTVIEGVLQGLKKYSQLAKIIFLARLTMTGLTIAVLYFDRNIEIPLLAWILFYSIIFASVFSLVGKNLIRAKQGFQYSEIIRYAVPLGVASIITLLSSSSDSVIVGGYLNASSLAVYRAAITVSGVLGVVAVTPLTTTLLPEMSSSQKVEDVSHGLKLAMRFVTLAILPASLLVAGVSAQLLELFTSGGAYLSGTLTLELLGIFYVFVAIQSVLLVLLQARGKTAQVIIVGIITAGTDIGVALILVPHFGLAGAVTSKVAVSIDGASTLLWFTRAYLKDLDRWSFYLRGLSASGIPFVIVILLSTLISDRLLTLIPYTALFVFVYLGCIKLFGVLTAEDRGYLSQILPGRLNKLAAYL